MRTPIQPTADQQRRWEAAIAGLVEIALAIPPLEPIKPTYRLGSDIRVWRVRLTDGRIGWTWQTKSYYGTTTRHFLPPVIALRCRFQHHIACGFTREWALNPAARKHAEWKSRGPDLLAVGPKEYVTILAAQAAHHVAVYSDKAEPPPELQPIPNHLGIRGVGQTRLTWK